MFMSLKSLETLERNSSEVASLSNANTEMQSLYTYAKRLYRHKDGRLYFREFGGGALNVENQPEWTTEADALLWIKNEARCPLSGFGYTDDEAATLLAGGDVPKGSREIDEDAEW